MGGKDSSSAAFFYFFLGPPQRLRLAALRFRARRSARPCGQQELLPLVCGFAAPLRIARPIWPSAIPRAKALGYRIIVIPSFEGIFFEPVG